MRPATPLIDALTSLRTVHFLSVITITFHFKQLKQWTKDTPNAISLTLYFRCLTHFFQVPHYILHVCVWSATLLFMLARSSLLQVCTVAWHPPWCGMLLSLGSTSCSTPDSRYTMNPVCLLFNFCSLFAFCLHYWEDTHHTVNPVCLLFIFCSLFAFCLCLLGGYHEPTMLFIFCSLFAFCLHYWEDTHHPVNPVCLLFIFCSLLFAFIIGRLQWTPVSFVFCSLFALCLHYWEGLSTCSKWTLVVTQSYIQTVCWPLFHATFSDHRQVWC